MAPCSCQKSDNSIAAIAASGVIERSRTRTPTAADTAFPMAAAVGPW
jgi:hypothetical protein